MSGTQSSPKYMHRSLIFSLISDQLSNSRENDLFINSYMYHGSYRTSIYIFLQLTFATETFHLKNPRSVHFKNCKSDFQSRNPSCSISKLANRIFTVKIRVRCISEFTTGIQFYPAKILVLCISKFATRIFTAKTRVANFDLNQTDFSAENSC